VWPLLLLASLLTFIFVLDDIWGLPVLPRLLVQLFCAAGVIWLAWPVSVAVALFLLIAIVWSSNVYNFMDGANGLAAGMAVFGFGTYALAAFQGDAAALASLSTAIAGSALAFLFYNFDPAKLFMGDAGSIPLGFLGAGIGVAGWSQELWGWWFPMLVFSPFLMDASVVVLRRLAQRKRISVAHRDHYYQRLIRAGLGHKRLALAAYLLMASAGGCALYLSHRTDLVPVAAAVWLLLYLGLFLYIDLRVVPMEPPAAGVSTLQQDQV